MSPKKIEVGRTYRNRGAGRTWRKVQFISMDVKPWWSSDSLPPDDPGVQYIDSNGRVDQLFLRSFASWAGSEVTDE